MRELYLKPFEDASEEYEKGGGSGKVLLTKAEVNMLFGSLNIIISLSKALYNQVHRLSLSLLPLVSFTPFSVTPCIDPFPQQMRASISPIADGESLRLSSVFTTNTAFLKIYKQYTDNYDNSSQVKL